MFRACRENVNSDFNNRGLGVPVGADSRINNV